MTVEVRDGSGRFVTRAGGRTTRHSFSFGAHYDPANIGFGPLVAHNDEELPPGTGYPEHPHLDVEIITVVLSGALRHSSSVGSGLLGPGDVQRLSAGSGVVHSEVSEASVPTRFVQTWLRPTEPGGPPSYESAPGTSEPGLTLLVGGATGLAVGSRARLFGGALVAGSEGALPDAPMLHVFVTDGVLQIGDVLLGPADAARIRGEGGRSLRAVSDCTFLVWAA